MYSYNLVLFIPSTVNIYLEILICSVIHCAWTCTQLSHSGRHSPTCFSFLSPMPGIGDTSPVFRVKEKKKVKSKKIKVPDAKKVYNWPDK